LLEAFRRASHEVRELALVRRTGAPAGSAPHRRGPVALFESALFGLATRMPRFITELLEVLYGWFGGRRLTREVLSFAPDFI